MSEWNMKKKTATAVWNVLTAIPIMAFGILDAAYIGIVLAAAFLKIRMEKKHERSRR